MAIVLGLGCAKKPAQQGTAVRVAAAADLSAAFEELAQTYERTTGQRVELTFGSSGQLSHQIREGAPFDVFASANTGFADAAIEAGACDAATKGLYARGLLVVWSSRNNHAASLADLADNRFRSIAIANPEHAPYGRAAKQALERGGVWGAVEKHLVYAGNVRQALVLAQSGNADAAIVARSLLGPASAKDGMIFDVPEALYDPLVQALVACSRGKNPLGGKAFAAHVLSAEGKAVLQKHGFALPSERR